MLKLIIVVGFVCLGVFYFKIQKCVNILEEIPRNKKSFLELERELRMLEKEGKL